MILIIKGHDYRFEMENICRLFLPQEKINVIDHDSESNHSDENTIIALTSVHIEEVEKVFTVDLSFDDWHKTGEERIPLNQEDERDSERRLAVLLYQMLVKLFDFTIPWGAVTGVRPVKLMRRLIEQQGEQEAVKWFQDSLLVSEEKTALCLETQKAENSILSLSRPESFSLYLSIPFCPSRCDYCSFVSHTVERAAKLIPEYVDHLCEEIQYTGQLAKQLGLRLETVYMGGGTPTTMTAGQLARILGTVESSFDLSHLREYTVEAGRPDTVSEDKLLAIRSAGATRISINPQTLQDSVLETIGRRHTTEQFLSAFDLARKCGFDNINADLIAGLPGDSCEGFEKSLETLLSLSPECVTVHTLAMKRASNLVTGRRAEYEGGTQTVKMVDFSIAKLKENGYFPYYMYRQSRTLGGTENTGWAKPGFEGLYNVYIMDETHTILACGAGAVTKLRQPGGEYIERIFNYKFPYEYNSRFPDMTQRKGRVISFYETIPQSKTKASRD